MTPRRLPSNRRRSRGTRSWAEDSANGSTPMTVATAGWAPSVSSERDRQAVAGERRDGGLADPDPEVAPVRRPRKTRHSSTALPTPSVPSRPSAPDRRAVPHAGGDDQVERDEGEPLEPGRLAVEHDERPEDDGQRRATRAGAGVRTSVSGAPPMTRLMRTSAGVSARATWRLEFMIRLIARSTWFLGRELDPDDVLDGVPGDRHDDQPGERLGDPERRRATARAPRRTSRTRARRRPPRPPGGRSPAAAARPGRPAPRARSRPGRRRSRTGSTRRTGRAGRST